jgi:DNA-binding response OmpR family regulator
MAATLLRRLGYSVRSPAGGAEKEGGDRDVDLLITDEVIPRAGGGDLAARARAFSPGVRVLLTSTRTGDGGVEQGGLNRGVAHLQKPFTPSALARKVRELLDQLAPNP